MLLITFVDFLVSLQGHQGGKNCQQQTYSLSKTLCQALLSPYTHNHTESAQRPFVISAIIIIIFADRETEAREVTQLVNSRGEL